MKKAIVFIGSALFALSLGAQAKPVAKGGTKVAKVAAYSGVKIPKLLTYNQLMGLSTAQRAKYLGHIREALVQMEVMQNNMLANTEQVAMIDMLKEFLDQATFMDSAFADPPKPRGSGIPEIVKVGDKYQVGCSGYGPGTAKYILDPALNACVRAGLDGKPVDPSNGNYSACGKGFEPGYYAREGADYGSVGVCVAEASYKALSPDITCDGVQAEVGLGSPAPSCLRDPDHPARKGNKPFANVTSLPQYATAAEAVAALKGTSTLQPDSVDAIAKTAPAAPVDAKKPQAERYDPLAINKTGTYEIDKLAMTYNKGPNVVPTIANGAFSCANPYKFYGAVGTCAQMGTECPVDQGVLVKMPSSGAEYCIPATSFAALSKDLRAQICPKDQFQPTSTQLVCVAKNELNVSSVNPETIGKVLGGKDYTKPQIDQMIADGGKPAGPAPAGGACQWVPIGSCDPEAAKDKQIKNTFFKASKDNLAMKDQKLKALCIFSGNFSSYSNKKKIGNSCVPVTSIAGTGLKCTSGKDVICNPVAFGVSKDGKALCVPAKAKATLACAELVKNPLDFTDPAKTSPPKVTGAKWDEFVANFKTQFKNFCVEGNKNEGYGKAFQAYFCNECNAIGSTIASANQEMARSLNICAGEDNSNYVKPADPAGDAGAAPEAAPPPVY